MDDVHPLVRAAAGALDGARVPWCLLRGRDALHAPTGDVDLLVARPQLAKACRAAVEVGFAVRRRWADGSQAILLGYHAGAGTWVHLHLMTQTAFGDRHAIVLPAAAALLARRVRPDDIPVPAPDDAFWHLLLHCMLDKRRFGSRHRAELLRLLDDAGTDSPLAAAVDALLPTDSSAADLRALVAEHAWSRLEQLGVELHTRVCARPAVRARRLSREAVLFAHKAVEAVARPGYSMALLGPDGAGKSSVAAALCDSLPFPARRLYLGLEGGALARRSPSRVPGAGLARRVAYTWATYLQGRYHRARRRFVIYDRYPYDALLAGDALPSLDRLRRAALGRLLPAPGLTIVLDAPAATLLARKPEHTSQRLDQHRTGYRDLAGRLPRSVVVDADRPIAAVLGDVTEALWHLMAARHQRR